MIRNDPHAVIALHIALTSATISLNLSSPGFSSKSRFRRLTAATSDKCTESRELEGGERMSVAFVIMVHRKACSHRTDSIQFRNNDILADNVLKLSTNLLVSFCSSRNVVKWRAGLTSTKNTAGTWIFLYRTTSLVVKSIELEVIGALKSGTT